MTSAESELLLFSFAANPDMFSDMKDESGGFNRETITKWFTDNIKKFKNHYKASRVHFVVCNDVPEFEAIQVAWAFLHDGNVICNLDDYYKTDNVRLDMIPDAITRQKTMRARLAKHLQLYSPKMVDKFSPDKLKSIRDYAIN